IGCMFFGFFCFSWLASLLVFTSLKKEKFFSREQTLVRTVVKVRAPQSPSSSGVLQSIIIQLRFTSVKH
ncbi:hypothetical protein ATANTOWER_028741, partial [Ataeniobius toweri]|nr:hypothetical protein [Ataeniobius toweri]